MFNLNYLFRFFSNPRCESISDLGGRSSEYSFVCLSRHLEIGKQRRVGESQKCDQVRESEAERLYSTLCTLDSVFPNTVVANKERKEK